MNSPILKPGDVPFLKRRLVPLSSQGVSFLNGGAILFSSLYCSQNCTVLKARNRLVLKERSCPVLKPRCCPILKTSHVPLSSRGAYPLSNKRAFPFSNRLLGFQGTIVHRPYLCPNFFELFWFKQLFLVHSINK